MCGISGIISFKRDISSELIKAMTDSLKHRGPDDEGYVIFNKGNKITELYGKNSTIKKNIDIETEMVSGRILFGHRRLSIIDTTSAGHQPMSYKNGSLWIIYNGEIFNYIELREQLRARGHYFKTNTDTEVVLAAYCEWGSNCVRHFNGDWAFAIYDVNKGTILLSVDRLGVKSIYYTLKNGIFIFASEIKAILVSKLIEKAPDYSQLSVYLFTWMHDYSKYTMHKNIFRILPANNMFIEVNSGNNYIKKYWNCNVNLKREKYNDSKAYEYTHKVKELLTDAVRLRLRADVPVGTCLSGGLDSSIVVMIINQLLKKEGISSIGKIQKTFTSAYKKEKYVDESKWAKKIINTSKAKGYFIYPTYDEFEKDIDDLIYFQDDPFSSTSIYAQYKVMQEASKHVKVLLDGQGADELFGGYTYYYPIFILEGNWHDLLYKKHIYGNKKILQEVMKIFTIYIFNKLNGNQIIKNLFRSYHNLKNSDIYSIYNSITNKKIDYDSVFNVLGFRNHKYFNCFLFNEITKHNLPSLLRYEDRNSMRWSVEARVPFTDYRLIELVTDIPSAYKIHNGWSKWLLRLLSKDLLPSDIIWRKYKMGFPTPEKEWMKKLDIYRKELQTNPDWSNYKTCWWRLYNIKKFCNHDKKEDIC